MRQDIRDENRLVLPGAVGKMSREFSPNDFRGIARLAARNIEYLGVLDALDQWYRAARAPFFARQELGGLVLEGALRALASARKERAKRLGSLLRKLPGNTEVERQLA